MALTKVIGNGLGAVTQDGAATFNEGSADVDFRVESNGNANMLFVDGGNDNVNIGTNSNIAPANGTNLYVEDGTIARFGLNKTGSNARKFSIGNAGTYLNIYDETLDAEVFKIDSTGAVTKPLQPAFSAKVTSQQSNIATSSQVTMLFATELYDQNSDYNNSAYTFTAPVTGKYQLNVLLLLDNLDTVPGYYQTQLRTSNRVYYHTHDPRGYSQDLSYHNLDVSILADMDAGDTAYVTMYQAGGTQQTDIDAESYFTGYLVC